MRLLIFISTLISCFTISINAQNGLDNPITKAMMDVYQQQLDENPQDYDVYFKRAIEYYNRDIYNNALSDINNALAYIPATETDMKLQALNIRASIYEATKDYEKALNDLNEAYNLDKNSYAILYRKANAEYMLKDYIAAKADYKRMLRLNNRSVEALIGIARIVVLENDKELANEYADNAVAIASSDANVFVKRASVRKMMGNNIGAVDDLIISLSMDGNAKALHELIELANSDYNSVITGLSNAIRHAPKVGMHYYVRGVIACEHFNYSAALADFKKIVNENLYNYHGLHKDIAKCQYALGDYKDAIYNINYAINGDQQNCEYNTIKAQILRASDRADEAVKFCDIALKINANYTPAIIEKGLNISDLQKHEQASALYGEAILNEANNPYYLLLKADLLDKKLNQPNDAKYLYERVVEMNFEKTNINSLKGFALLSLNKYDEAIAWIENILQNTTDNDGIKNYYGACLYSQIGDTDKAFECMKTSLQKGYSNYHNWVKNNDTNVNVAPIRNDKRFNSLMTQYSLIFK